VCVGIHEYTGNWCIGANLELDVVWESLWLGYGETAYAEDGQSLGYSNNQPYIDYLHMLLRLQEAGAIPSIADIRTDTSNTQAIVGGEAATGLMWSNQMIGTWNEAGEGRHFMMVHLPRPADGCCASNYVKPSMFLAISANSEHPEEAALLIDFFTNSVEANRILLAERGVPISNVVQQDLRDYISPAQLEMFEFLSRVEQDNSPLPAPNPAVHQAIFNEAFDPLMIDPVLFGEISPEEGVALFEEEALRLLSQE
jgi:multiple sugar transport system substrate-binding protein